MTRDLVVAFLAALCGAAAMLLISTPGSLRQENVAAAQIAPPPGPRGTEPHEVKQAPLPPALPTAPPANLDADLTPDERVNIAVYEKVNRSAVNISTKGVRADNPFFELTTEGEGSGAVLDVQGRVLTNFHVVENAREIQVTLYDGKSYDAELVGLDQNNDTAILKINAPLAMLHPVTLGDSSNLRVGQRVFAFGNPFGLERTMTTGIVSSLNRSITSPNGRTIRSIIQIDAAINPGNSGGPLCDSSGRLIGMNTAIASRVGQSAGVGFAIPIGTIARIVPQLIEKGRIVRPDVGIERVFQTDRGLLIAGLTPGGPAEKAGLVGPKTIRQRRQQGPIAFDIQTVDRSAADVVTSVDGHPIRTAEQLLDEIEKRQPGETVSLGVLRGGKEIEIVVPLGETKP